MKCFIQPNIANWELGKKGTYVPSIEIECNAWIDTNGPDTIHALFNLFVFRSDQIPFRVERVVS